MLVSEMETIETILMDWQHCKPHGVVLPIYHFDAVLARLLGHFELLPDSAMESVNKLLVPASGSSLSPIQQMLLGSKDRDVYREHIHFPRFWQAYQAISILVKQVEPAEEAPLVDEITTFRDAVLKHYDTNQLTCSWLKRTAAFARDASSDKSAWTGLDAFLSAMNTDKEMDSLDTISVALLFWAQEMAEDYCHGTRRAMICTFRDVAKCKTRDACIHLGGSNWDFESALRTFYGPGDARIAASGGAVGWSSAGAKLRTKELECPICFSPYGDDVKTKITRCCFQVICISCAGKLPDKCPFCRSTESGPLATSDAASMPSTVWDHVMSRFPRNPRNMRPFTWVSDRPFPWVREGH